MYSNNTFNTPIWRCILILCVSILWACYGSTSLQGQMLSPASSLNLVELQATNGPRIYSNIDSVRVATPFNITLVGPNIKDGEVIFPDSSSFPPTLFLSKATYEKGISEDSVQYTFQYFGNQDLVLNSLQIRYNTQDDTLSITVPSFRVPFSSRLEPMIARGDSLALNPIKPNYTFVNPWIYVLILIVLITILILLWWYYRFRNKETKPKHSVELPVYESPLENLQSELKSIQEVEFPKTDGTIKVYYSRISDAFRDYYEILYGFPALESTSRELLEYLNQIAESTDLITKIGTLLMKADRVKFAKFKPNEEQIRLIIDESFACLDLLSDQHKRRLQTHKEEFQQLHGYPQNSEPRVSLQ